MFFLFVYICKYCTYYFLQSYWEYDLIVKNCETFVLYIKGIMKKDQQYSHQVCFFLFVKSL